MNVDSGSSLEIEYSSYLENKDLVDRIMTGSVTVAELLDEITSGGRRLKCTIRAINPQGYKMILEKMLEQGDDFDEKKEALSLKKREGLSIITRVVFNKPSPSSPTTYF